VSGSSLAIPEAGPSTTAPLFVPVAMSGDSNDNIDSVTESETEDEDIETPARFRAMTKVKAFTKKPPNLVKSPLRVSLRVNHEK
jgi:hypothetical protein